MGTANHDTPPKMLDTRAAAELLGLAPGTLQNWRKRGEGPEFRRHGSRAVRYALPDLEAFSEAGRRSSTADDGPGPDSRPAA